jgi:hypothetical protein
MSAFFRKLKLGALAAGISFSKDAAKKDLALQLLDMRGLPTKFVQIKALMHSEEATVWNEAISEIRPIPISEFEETIRNTHPSLHARITLDTNEKGYPASIGQVQKAVLDGDKVIAIKMRHTNVEEQVVDDVDMISLAGKMFSMLNEGFPIDEYQKMMTQRLAEEMDLLGESQAQNKFRSFFLQHSGIKIPEAFTDLSDRDILCQEWIDAIPAETFLSKCSPEEKKDFSDLISQFYFDSIFELGCIHTDPNPGNFGVIVRPEGLRLVIFDFGSVYQLSKIETLAIWGLIQNQINPTWDDLHFLKALGFHTDSLSNLGKKIPAYLSVILEPFLAKTRYNLNSWNRKERCSDILGSEKFQFMISAPANFFPVLRAFQGLFHWCFISSGDLWLAHKISKKSIEMTSALKDFSNTFPKEKRKLASCLRIDVWRDNAKTVSLNLPREAIEQLEQLIEPALLEKIAANGINIKSIQKKARVGAYQPEELITWQDGDKRIRIYLE